MRWSLRIRLQLREEHLCRVLAVAVLVDYRSETLFFDRNSTRLDERRGVDIAYQVLVVGVRQVTDGVWLYLKIACDAVAME